MTAGRGNITQRLKAAEDAQRLAESANFAGYEIHWPTAGDPPLPRVPGEIRLTWGDDRRDEGGPRP